MDERAVTSYTKTLFDKIDKNCREWRKTALSVA